MHEKFIYWSLDKSAILAKWKNCQNGTFEPVHEIHKSYKDLIKKKKYYAINHVVQRLSKDSSLIQMNYFGDLWFIQTNIIIELKEISMLWVFCKVMMLFSCFLLLLEPTMTTHQPTHPHLQHNKLGCTNHDFECFANLVSPLFQRAKQHLANLVYLLKWAIWSSSNGHLESNREVLL